jgi:outer membrane biogenesis lipoprotein LolB
MRNRSVRSLLLPLVLLAILVASSAQIKHRQQTQQVAQKHEAQQKQLQAKQPAPKPA